MSNLVAAYTLVVYAADPSSREQLLPLCRAVMRRHPCRALVLSECEEADHLSETRTLEGVEGTDSGKVCDCIELSYGSAQRDRVATFVLSQVLTDLPIYVVWGGAPDPCHPVVQALAPHMARAIFLAPPSYDPKQYSEQLLDFSQRLPADICDLGWALLAPWRQALRTAFNCSERVQLLQNCQRVRIEHAPTPLRTCPSAAYLQGWLAAQLGWDLEDQVLGDLLYSTPKGAVHVELAACDSCDAKEGSVHTVVMTCRQGMTLSFSRDEVHEKVHLKLWTPRAEGEPYTVDLPTRPREQVLAKLLFDRGTHPQYKRVLNLIAAKRRDH